MTTVQHIKLVSGEEIVATVLDNLQSDHIKIKNVRALVVVQRGPQQYGLEFYPFLRGDPDGTMYLMRAAITAYLPANKELETSYLSHTSGIEIASSLSPLIGS